jgi:four helix bundle protein
VKSPNKYDLQERLVKFSAMIIMNTSLLENNYASQHLIKQLIRSSTAAVLNYGEAQSGESRKDFIHKMKVSLKELRESQVNLQILAEAKLVRNQENYNIIKKECNELVAIFASSIKTTKLKM